MAQESIATARFDVTVFAPERTVNTATLIVYLEGDGHAWRTPSQPSDDPTPIRPVALELALADPRPNVVYVARPCQYLAPSARRCDARDWTDARFAPEIVDAVGEAIDVLKRRVGAGTVELVGFSGGGVVAALLTARRDDVDRLVTVAGNLDTAAWTAWHRVRPLTGSLNPADFVAKLGTIEQVHFVGDRDRVMPRALVDGFVAKLPTPHRARVESVAGADHTCCWVEGWAARIAR